MRRTTLALPGIALACGIRVPMDDSPADTDTPVHTDSPTDTDTPADTDTDVPPTVSVIGDTADPDTFVVDDTGPWPEVPTPPEVGLCTEGGWCWVSPRPHGLTLRDVDGTGPDDVWAVGDAGIVDHWDGSTWTSTQLPDQPGLTAVVVDSPGHPCVVGQRGLFACLEDGTWVAQPSPTSHDLTSLARSPEGSWWISSWDEPSAERILHQQTATGWTPHTELGGAQVQVIADDDIWAAPFPVSPGAPLPATTFLAHWDGAAWTPTQAIRAVDDLTGSGAGDVWVSHGATYAELRRLEGSTFEVVDPPRASLRVQALHALDPDTVVLVDPDAVWVGGPDGWERLAYAPTAFAGARAVWASSRDHVVVVGADGLLDVVTDGVLDRVRPSPSTRTTALAAAPGGGVFVDHDGLMRIEGPIRRHLEPPADLPSGARVSELVSQGRHLWAYSHGVVPPSTALDPTLYLRGPDRTWASGPGENRLVVGARGEAAVWGLHGAANDCHLIRRTLDPDDAEPVWPPAPTPLSPSCNVQVAVPGRVLWASSRSATTWTEVDNPYDFLQGSTSVARFDGHWSTLKVFGARALTVAVHPTTRTIGALTVDGWWALLDLASLELVQPVQLTAPNDWIRGVFPVDGELVVLVSDRDDEQRWWMIRWDGSTVRRDPFPPAFVVEVVKDADGYLWASTAGGLLVHLP